MTGVELLIVGWFAPPVIKAVSDKAKEILSDNYQLHKDAKMMVRELTSTLLVCEGTIIELQKKPIINNPDLAGWLRELKETVYDADDVLDNIEAKSIKEKLQGYNKVWKFASSSFSTVGNLVVPDDNLQRLKKVLVQLNEFSIRTPSILQLVKMNENNESHIRRVNVSRETISKPLGNVGFHGREVELERILNIILPSKSKSRHIIPIVGTGGVGKTALAQAVYNNHMVQQTFNKREWISVANKPDVDAKSVLREINQSLGYETPTSVRLQDIFLNLTLRIGEIGKFLIVLDDVFEIITSEWEYIRETLLSHCVPGSVVLITTQNQEFANRVATSNPIALSTLNPDIYWELFKRFAFGDQMVPHNLNLIGTEIAAKLNGLPLAAKIIGNHLRTNVDEVRWRQFLNNEWWNIREVKSQILPFIGLGYEQLNPSLRQCFAYCSVFPRNSLIKKDRLVHMWMAQNFIHSDENGGMIMMNLEYIGRQWFDELVEKFFFQHGGDDNSYVMPALMHDLAVIVSSRECFYLGEGLVKIPLGVRHLAVHTHNLDVIKGIRAHKNLRSILYFNRGEVQGMYSAINKMLSDLGSIRVLDLSDMPMEREREPPSSIWKLQHLRFLDLSSTGIKLLTSSRIGLYHLQVLYIQNCEFLEYPSSICQARIYQ